MRKHRAVLLAATHHGHTMKFKAIAPKPRNPLVMPASRRKAGPHRRSRNCERQRSRMALQRELPPVRGGTTDD
jgi:hypothetical protein